jgi:hypothetical protein
VSRTAASVDQERARARRRFSRAASQDPVSTRHGACSLSRKRGAPRAGARCPRHGESRSRRCWLPGLRLHASRRFSVDRRLIDPRTPNGQLSGSASGECSRRGACSSAGESSTSMSVWEDRRANLLWREAGARRASFARPGSPLRSGSERDAGTMRPEEQRREYAHEVHRCLLAAQGEPAAVSVLCSRVLEPIRRSNASARRSSPTARREAHIEVG